MNTRITFSLISIFAVLAMVGGATYAFFSSTASSTGNTFSSGTMTLLLDDADQLTPTPAVSGSVTFANASPGDSTSGFISLHNGGTTPFAEVEFGADTTVTNDPAPASDMATKLNMTVVVDDGTPDTACVNGTDVTSAIDTAVGNGGAPLMLSEFDDGGTDTYDSLTSTNLAAGETRNVCFTVEFDESADNDYQGDAVSTTFTFEAHQNASQ